jgi:hypothetical protein
LSSPCEAPWGLMNAKKKKLKKRGLKLHLMTWRAMSGRPYEEADMRWRVAATLFKGAPVVGPARYSSPRHSMPYNSENEHSQRASMTWRAMVLADSPRHVIGCHEPQETGEG